MGRPIGAPGDAKRQREVIEAALGLFEKTANFGSFRELPEGYAA